MTSLVALEEEAGIGVLRLNRPPMNAFNIEMQDALRSAAEAASASRNTHAVVVYGGEKVFASGADIKEMAAMSLREMGDRVDALQGAFNAVAEISKPVVAAVTGYALGGGCELALAADFRVCGESAKLGQPEITLGIIPGAGGTQRLPRLIGTSRAKELIYSGRVVSSAEALDMGLVDQVVPDDEVLSAARSMAGRFVGGPALALRAAKRAIDIGGSADLHTGLQIERSEFAALFGSADRANGMQSFVVDGPGKATFTGE